MDTGKIGCCALMIVGLTVLSEGQTRAGADSEIYACVNNNSGILKIVAAGIVCSKNETLIHWNQQGPAGPTGPRGPAGNQGPIGPQGPTGPQGPIGLTGMNGKDGVNGKDGADGKDGAQGPQGPQGDPGPTPLQVFDANNKLVGFFAGPGPTGFPNATIDGLVAFREPNLTFVLALKRGGFLQVVTQVFFASSNCTGTAYLRDNENGLLPQASIQGTDVYVEDTSFSVQHLTMNSSFAYGPDARQICGNGGSTAPQFVRPAIVFSNFLEQFQSPFSVR